MVLKQGYWSTLPLLPWEAGSHLWGLLAPGETSPDASIDSTILFLSGSEGLTGSLEPQQDAPVSVPVREASPPPAPVPAIAV